jgi:hypothetical protein
MVGMSRRSEAASRCSNQYWGLLWAKLRHSAARHPNFEHLAHSQCSLLHKRSVTSSRVKQYGSAVHLASTRSRAANAAPLTRLFSKDSGSMKREIVRN